LSWLSISFSFLKLLRGWHKWCQNCPLTSMQHFHRIICIFKYNLSNWIKLSVLNITAGQWTMTAKNAKLSTWPVKRPSKIRKLFWTVIVRAIDRLLFWALTFKDDRQHWALCFTMPHYIIDGTHNDLTTNWYIAT